MTKENLFQQVSAKVTEITGLSSAQLLSSTTEECTDARYLLVRSLSMLNLTDIDIAHLIGRTRQAVSHLRISYKRSRKWLLANQWQILVKWLENEYFLCK